MKYFSLDTVVAAYKANKGITKNKFWGLLAILSSLDKVAKPAVSYDFSTAMVSEFLEQLFFVDDDKRNYSSDSTWNIMLSNQWVAKVSDQMFSKTPNIYDIAVWYFRLKPFDDGITPKDIISLFLTESNISLEDAKKLFDFTAKELSFSDTLYFESELFRRSGLTGADKSVTFESDTVKARPGELARAPFIQTLYAGQSTLECLIITPFKFSDYYQAKGILSESQVLSNQTIYYGSPGTGKSFKVKKYLKDNNIPEDYIFRTTFHPDSDYASFVGGYKPVTEEGKITYKFVPQSFTEAYVKAKKCTEQVYLVIEEINRGNCAQIFGDLFQLLDRKNGVSEYPIKGEADLIKYLNEECGIPGDTLSLPANLNIIATMNTSDQSLFPMDSAFKRRWDWKYIPTTPPTDEDKTFELKVIKVGDFEYSWKEFLKAVNEKIYAATRSEDKQLGYWFVKTGDDNKISISDFVSKVVFYLWNDVFKDLGPKDCNPFTIEVDGKKSLMSFNSFFELGIDNNITESIGVLHTFLKNFNLTPDVDKEVQKAQDASNSEGPQA